MSKSTTAIVLSVLAMSAAGNANAQAVANSLTSTAVHDGYNLRWLLPERSVRLYRPGMVIVIRPGVTMYEVNDRVEFADAAPRFVNGDMLISSALAARLGRLASAAAVSRKIGRAAQAQVRYDAQDPATAGGSITLDVRPQQGSEALAVSGRAPSGAPVTITLLATLSPDLPTVVVSRHDVQPDTNGQFQATIPIASDYFRNSTLHVLATSSAGVTPASTTVTVGAPNAGVTVQSDKPYCSNINPACH